MADTTPVFRATVRYVGPLHSDMCHWLTVEVRALDEEAAHSGALVRAINDLAPGFICFVVEKIERVLP